MAAWKHDGSLENGVVTVPESHLRVWPGSSLVEAASSGETIEVTIWLRARAGGEIDYAAVDALGATPPAARAYLTGDDLRRMHGADPDDVRAVRRYCIKHHLSVIRERWRALVVHGTIGAFSRAFGTEIGVYACDGRHFRSRSGWLRVPREIAPLIDGIFGLSEWPSIRAKRTTVAQFASSGARPGMLAHAIESQYAFPRGADGTGQTIGILQAGGTFCRDDFETAMRLHGVKAAPVFHHRIDDAAVHRKTLTVDDGELALDTQVVGALAPGTAIMLYAAPDSERGFLDAVAAVVFEEHRPVDVLSISFVWPEPLWSRAALRLFDLLFAAAALRGITICCATGDWGAADNDVDGHPHVNAPASSRFALACGGTQIDTAAPAGETESGWLHSGGGFSEYALPEWQSGVAAAALRESMSPGRGLPDVVAQAAPGIRVRLAGRDCALEGTSAVAPLWAALVARLNERLGANLGYCTPLLYAPDIREAFRRIERGSNGLYRAGREWNPCTGLGAPQGDLLLHHLSAAR